VRGGIVGGGKKANGTTPGPGWRVWKIQVNRVNREILKTLYKDVIYKRNGNIPKGLLCYAEKWEKMYENTKRQREEAGKRTPPKTPPVLVPVRFVMPDGSVRGKKDAACVIDLRKGELRVPSYGVVQKLRRSLVRALVEENSLDPRPEFTLQVTRKCLARLIASRAPPRRGASALLLVCMDENLGHGLYTTLIRFDAREREGKSN
jgi:hypothetical protein